MRQRKITNDLGGFFPEVCSLTPPTINHKRVKCDHSVHPPLSSGGGVGWGVDPPTKFSKREAA